MPFEKFTHVGTRGFKPVVSVWKSGQISFNQGAVLRYEIAKLPCVVLYYDRDEKKIGIEFTKNEDDPGALKIVSRGTGAMVSARSFLDYYNIEYEKTRRFDPDYDADQNLYILDLEDAK